MPRKWFVCCALAAGTALLLGEERWFGKPQFTRFGSMGDNLPLKLHL